MKILRLITVLVFAGVIIMACSNELGGGEFAIQMSGEAEWVPSTSNIALTWSAVSGAVSYQIYHAGSRFGVYSFVETVSGNTFTHSLDHPQVPMNPNRFQNYYRVYAVNADGERVSSVILSLELSIFGPNMLFFDAAFDTVDGRINAIRDEINRIHDMETFGNVTHADGRSGQFSARRFAFLFKPGEYIFDNVLLGIQIGFNTHIGGLGRLPTDTTLRGTIRTPAHLNTPDNPNNATCTFWRSAGNFQLSQHPTANNVFRWGVSQSSPIRRMQVNIPTFYHMYGGWASGGFTADTKFTAAVDGGSQQQWYTRNSDFSEAMTGVSWNRFIQGSTGALPPANFTQIGNGTTIVDTTPIIREKPFLFLDNDGEYKVFVPALRHNAVGISWGTGMANDGMGEGEILDLLEYFYIAREGRSTAASINAQIAAGKHIFFTPGIYNLDAPIRVSRPGTIVFGHGFPALFPMNPYGALFIYDVPNVTVAGLMIDATNSNPIYLLAAGPMIGDPGQANTSGIDHSAAPTLLADIFFRVGGFFSHAVHADISALINKNNVIGDHFWVWRADHSFGPGIDWDLNTSRNGLVVRGNDVTFYGLFVEHFHEYNTLWIGERGRTFFYQNELPYDPHFQHLYMSHGGTVLGWAQYKVANTVHYHTAMGLGMYAVFMHRPNGVREPIFAQNAMEVPHNPGIQIHNAIITNLSMSGWGGIHNLINNAGPSATAGADGSSRILHFDGATGRVTLAPGAAGAPIQYGTPPADEEHLVWLRGRNLLP